MGDNIKRVIRQYYDNSYENIGAWNSYTWYAFRTCASQYHPG